ncbi:MAG: HAD-IC family P-type ATPase, partial [Geminicoccaceae bacterium]|nr:HAD-IC family P-type ATPase [Geminicoccaceae bacterium]
MPEAWRPGPLRRFLRQFHNPLIYVLVAASAVTLATGHVADTAVILAVVLVNALLGFVQEGRAERSMEAIRGMLAPQATVRRDGRRMTLRGEDLVPGDLVILEPGDRVPADLRLIEAHALSIDEAILTGESVPAAKDIRPVPAEAGPGERASMAHSGTFVTTGSGLGVVTATGPATEIGRISWLVGGIEPVATPLVRQMDAFARWLTVLILIVAGLAVALAVLGRGMAFEEGLMIALGLAVAAIPEGLPAVLTIALAIGVRAMAGS